ncbi:MAG: dihydrolipoyl dehydrogenase [Propylenella sp.]
MPQFDVAIIGTGPGGYVCAIRAAQLGLKVAAIEKRATHGGTCLNVGCIPSKALLHTSELFHEAAHGFEKFGIKVKPELDLKAMLAHKDATVKANTDGVAFLFKKNKIDAFRGAARILAPGRIEVRGEDGSKQAVETKAIVVATGSESTSLPGVTIDEKRVVTSTGALELESVPQRLLVVGAGVIGLEIGSVWQRLGAKVTVIEFLDRILPGMDGEVAKQSQRIFQKQGFDFRLSSKVTGVTEKAGALEVAVAPSKGEGGGETLQADIVLVAIGRGAFTDGLGLAEIGVALDERGRVKTDAHFKTNVDGIYAIGDAIAGPMLAHKAEDEGTAVAEILAGQAGHVNYSAIPSVVYTMPEIAVVGRGEEELKEAGVAYKVGKFPLTANSRARAMNKTDGFVKVLADKATDRVLGVHMIGASASEMIQEAAVLMEFSGSAEDLARTCHSHPTMSEAVREAAMAAWFKPVHI